MAEKEGSVATRATRLEKALLLRAHVLLGLAFFLACSPDEFIKPKSQTHGKKISARRHNKMMTLTAMRSVRDGRALNGDSGFVSF
jgi:hypothetical protein